MKRGESTFKGGSYTVDSGTIGAEVVERQIRESRCVIINADEREPCSYFWMGFAHGLEKDVIPVTVIERVPFLWLPRRA